MKKHLLTLSLLLTAFSSYSYAECRHENFERSYKTANVSSASYNESNDTVTVNITYTQGAVLNSGMTCTNSPVGYSNQSVTIGNSSSPSYKVLNERGLLSSFVVPVANLDKTMLSNGDYTIQTNFSATQAWNLHTVYYIWNNGQAPSSIITGLAPSYQTVSEYKNSPCPVEASLGSIKEGRTYKLWRNGSKTDYTNWVVTSNTCKLIPDTEITTKSGYEEVSCDVFFGAIPGSYTGTVIKYGQYVTSYNSKTKETNTFFTQTSADSTSCVLNNEKTVKQETININCPDGQSGTITKSRYYIINEKNEKTYPYGEEYIVNSNSCTGTDNPIELPSSTNSSNTTLLSNFSITSSQISNGSYLNHLKKIKAAGWIPDNKHYILEIIVDDMSYDKYSQSKMTETLKSFKSTVGEIGEYKIISVPNKLDLYKGYNGISDYSNKFLKNTKINDQNQVVVEYFEMNNKDRDGGKETKSFTVPLFNQPIIGLKK